MITIHHLGVSQSNRVVWLMEELEQPYELKWYDRGDDFLAPQAYRDLHPAGTAPVITDGDLRRHMGDAMLALRAVDVMTPAPQTIRDSALAAEALP